MATNEAQSCGEYKTSSGLAIVLKHAHPGSPHRAAVRQIGDKAAASTATDMKHRRSWSSKSHKAQSLFFRTNATSDKTRKYKVASFLRYRR